MDLRVAIQFLDDKYLKPRIHREGHEDYSLNRTSEKKTMKLILLPILALTSTLGLAKLPANLVCSGQARAQQLKEVTLQRLNSPKPIASFKDASVVEYTRDDQGLFLRFTDKNHSDYALSFTLGDLQRLEAGETLTITGTLEYYQVKQATGAIEETIALQCHK